MEFKKGDRVKFLNDVGGGIITRMINANEAMVETEDGFEIPEKLIHLVKTQNVDDKNNSQRNLPSVEVAEIVEEELQKKVSNKPAGQLKAVPMFALVPNAALDSPYVKFEIHLLNDGDLDFSYIVSIERSGKSKVISSGSLEAGLSIQTGIYSKTQLQQYTAIHVQLLHYSDDEFQTLPPVWFKFIIDSMNIARSINFKENEFFDTKALIIEMKPEATMNAEMINYDASAVEFLKEKYEIDQKPAEKKIKVENPTSDIEEVDLHIEEIIDNFANLSNGEIVNIQLARFTTALEGAILSKTKRIVFIHGVGNGKLKYELCKTLDTKYPDLKYQDASYAEYGFGATMVFLK